MATKKKKAGSKELSAAHQQEVAKYRKRAQTAERSTGGGAFISLQGGRFVFQDDILDNPLSVIVVGEARDFAHYPGVYDANNPAPPDCFAVGNVYDTTEMDMAPDKASPAAQADKCADCKYDRFGTADTGRGKGCTQKRKLAVIYAGDNPTPAAIRDAEVVTMRVPVTSVKYWDAFCLKLDKAANKAPFEIVTKLELVEDKKTQFQLHPHAGEALSDEQVAAVLDVMKTAELIVVDTTGYTMTREDDEATKPGRGKKGPKKKASKKKTSKKAPASKTGGKKKAAKKAPRRKF